MAQQRECEKPMRNGAAKLRRLGAYRVEHEYIAGPASPPQRRRSAAVSIVSQADIPITSPTRPRSASIETGIGTTSFVTGLFPPRSILFSKACRPASSAMRFGIPARTAFSCLPICSARPTSSENSCGPIPQFDKRFRRLPAIRIPDADQRYIPRHTPVLINRRLDSAVG